MNYSTALVLIDVQNNMFDVNHSVYQSEIILIKLKKLLKVARDLYLPVVFIQNNCKAGQPDHAGFVGWKLHPEFQPTDEDLVVQKFQTDAFENTSLHSLLQMLGITDLVIAGLQSETDILVNCKKAHEIGYQVILVQDAHSTYDSKTEKAADIIQRINDDLENTIAMIEVDDCENSLFEP
jgi:streptothricin hydrolase